MLDPKHRSIIETEMSVMRSTGNHLTRMGFFDPLQEKFPLLEYGTYCTAPHKYHKSWKENHILFHVFNGETPQNSASPGGHMKGGELSRAYLGFLLDPEVSPFYRTLAHVENLDDLDKINAEGGVIVTDYHGKIGAGEMLGFLIALRYAQEQNQYCKNWKWLVDSGIEPRLAYVLSWGWKWDQEGKKVTVCSRPGHASFYNYPYLWIRNWLKREFPKDKPLVDGLQSSDRAIFDNDLYGSFKDYASELRAYDAPPKIAWLGIGRDCSIEDAVSRINSFAEGTFDEKYPA